ncbi:M10 family metallopeptidase C-terminal domain-containing protein [Paracoccus aminophilus]|uniref:M10 family metallopeptidase C-terminal domain-containing protein n=1 Tax=Paracoccus aminophilus TaxID=34003 RepID=UPI0006887F2D|nr:M10 family metallopeptidase C-terminal domain-containing protein [Paracoccus aminophilus]
MTLDAARFEGSFDALASIATSARMSVGDTFSGRLSWAGDVDWIGIDLSAGQRIQVDVTGIGRLGLNDPLLVLRDMFGNVISTFDDSNGTLNPTGFLTAATAGRYFIEVQGYTASGFLGAVGEYRVSVSSVASPPVFTPAQIAHQLTDGFWENLGESRRSFDVAPGGTLNVDLSGLNAAGKSVALMALNTWSEMSGIKFNTNLRPGQTAHIVIDDNRLGRAYATHDRFSADGHTERATINIGSDWIADYGRGLNSYGYQTYLHEIGHALGLGHAGNYNGNAVYGVDELFRNDSWQATIMSYFSQSQNTSINASYAFTATPMIADLIAIRDLYGPTQLRTGDTIYGEGSNAGGVYGLIARQITAGLRDKITFTIHDDGGRDTLDLHSDKMMQSIDLTPGSVSSAYGLTGNISISASTVIENVIAGSSHDLIIGNDADNQIWGGAGNDTIYGGAGNDTLYGGAGANLLVGGTGNDVYVVTDPRDRIVEARNAGIDTVISIGNDYRLGANLENLTLQGRGPLQGTGNGLDNVIRGNIGANVLSGLGGNDTIFGGAGHDLLMGGAGNDRLVGGAGRDTLLGGIGNDTLLGGAGNDELRGGAGNDVLYGGAGADRFIFEAGHDAIMDFQRGVDTIVLSERLWGGRHLTTAQVLQMASEVAGHVVFDFGNGNRLDVHGVQRVAHLADDLAFL